MMMHQNAITIIFGVALCIVNVAVELGCFQQAAGGGPQRESWNVLGSVEKGTIDNDPVVAVQPPNPVATSLAASSIGATNTTTFAPPPQVPPPVGKKKETNIKRFPVLDILSTGSTSRDSLLEAQRATFAQHPAVRRFFTVTEANDTDAACHQQLTDSDVHKIAKFCHAPYRDQTEPARLIRVKKFLPRDDAGWLCAQKRPLDGLAALMKEDDYSSGDDGRLPDYLLLIDDDSYVNVAALLKFVSKVHPPHEPHAISGCRLIGPNALNFAFPVGGFGAILTKRTLQNMRKPIYCASNTAKADKFTQFACWRLQVNDMLERHFFREGMSVMDLMIAYSQGLPFSQYRQWADGHGFCLHSDLALAYFVNYYHVAVPDDVLARRSISDKVRFKYLGFVNFNNTKAHDQCAFEGENCLVDSKLCHYMTPLQMRDLWELMAR